MPTWIIIDCIVVVRRTNILHESKPLNIGPVPTANLVNTNSFYRDFHVCCWFLTCLKQPFLLIPWITRIFRESASISVQLTMKGPINWLYVEITPYIKPKCGLELFWLNTPITQSANRYHNLGDCRFKRMICVLF